MIKPWPLVSSKPLENYRIFSVRTDVKISPRTGMQHDFFVIDTSNWVNVIAVTPDQKLVMVEQYRHGSNTVELEIPGGVMDPGDSSPVVAGERELVEETGFRGKNAQLIGEIIPNPAIMNNRCFTLLVEECVLRAETAFDHGEDILTRLVPVNDIPMLVNSGQIRHSLVVVALFHFDLFRQRRADS